MINSIKIEAKTLIHMKSVWLFSAVLLVVSVMYLVRGYSAANESTLDVVSIIKEMQEYASSEDEVDYSDIELELKEIYKTYNPKMSVNNSFGIFYTGSVVKTKI